MKRIIRVVLLIFTICIFVSITCSRINYRMVSIEQYALYTQNLIMDKKYDNSKELASKGYIVSGIVNTYNLDKLYEFINNVKMKNKAGVRVITYTTEGDPIIYDLKYSGKKIEVTKDNRRDSFAAIKDRKVEKTKYDDLIAESSIGKSNRPYTCFYLISGDDKKELLLYMEN